jgi:hypothetical protein
MRASTFEQVYEDGLYAGFQVFALRPVTLLARLQSG